MPASFDRIARPYRWLEYASFGPMLERCRFCRIPQLASAHGALVLGDGDGRFLARLLASNPQLRADVVDSSPAMLRLLESRVAASHASHRVRIQQCDVRDFEPRGPYDLIVSHFFLDCLTTDEVAILAERIRPHLAPGAFWIVSEFAISSGLAALPARAFVAALYLAFRIITRLRTRSLPDYATAFRDSGLILEDRKPFLGGLLVSDVWKLA